MISRREIPLEQFQAEYAAQAHKVEDVVFVCPQCRTLQSGRDFINAGIAEEMDDLQYRLGTSCIGRFITGTGCDLTLGGLQVHTLAIVTPDGESVPHFELASVEDAAAHRARMAAEALEQ
jgi:hypothetical protein